MSSVLYLIVLLGVSPFTSSMGVKRDRFVKSRGMHAGSEVAALLVACVCMPRTDGVGAQEPGASGAEQVCAHREGHL